MITFGGRPLNTYKGGSGLIEVQPESVTFNYDKSQPNQLTKESNEPQNEKLTIESFESNDPVVIQVQPESVSFEQETTNPMHADYAPANSFTIGGTVLNHKDLVKLDKQLIKARFKNGFFAKIFGVEIVTACIYIASTSKLLYSLFILFVIFCICTFLITFLQLILDVCHKTLDFVVLSLKGINKVLGGALNKPIKDVKKANNSFPRKASVLIIKILTSIFKGLGLALPGMLEGMAKGLDDIFK